jgi:hypothetical protein
MGESVCFITRGFPCKIGPLCEACYNRESVWGGWLTLYAVDSFALISLDGRDAVV